MKLAIRYSVITILIDLIIAYAMLGALVGEHHIISFLNEIVVNLAFGILFLFLTGTLMAERMYIWIQNQHKLPGISGVGGLLIILSIGILGACIPTIIEETVHSGDSFGDIVTENFWFPYVVILLFGGLPTIISGAILGNFIARIKE